MSQEEEDELKQCRVCLELSSKVLSPCSCSGSIQFICETCFVETWVEQGTNCTICKQRYTCKPNAILLAKKQPVAPYTVVLPTLFENRFQRYNIVAPQELLDALKERSRRGLMVVFFNEIDVRQLNTLNEMERKLCFGIILNDLERKLGEVWMDEVVQGNLRAYAIALRLNPNEFLESEWMRLWNKYGSPILKIIFSLAIFWMLKRVDDTFLERMDTLNEDI